MRSRLTPSHQGRTTGDIDYTATFFDRQQNETQTVSTFAVAFTTLPDPCTEGFETAIAASEGTVSDPTCIIDEPDGWMIPGTRLN